MIRREFLKIALSSLVSDNVIPGSWSDKKIATDTSFAAKKYSKEKIIDMLLIGREEFLKGIKPLDYNLELALMVKFDIPVITERCNASHYSGFGYYDAYPDPGHINYKKVHPITNLVNQFDKRFQNKNIKDLIRYKVFIRIREI
jgi:hypothetical protein